MRTPMLHTERLLSKPLKAGDAPQIQVLYPRWGIVHYMVSSIPWSYPDNGAENYANNVALPDMERGIAWIWTIRLHEAPDTPIGLIYLYDVEDNNRGFWLVLEYRGQDFTHEVSNVAADYWSNTLSKMVLRAPKTSLDIRPKRISDSSGMRLIRAEKKEYVSGSLGSELWETACDEWNARQRWLI